MKIFFQQAPFSQKSFLFFFRTYSTSKSYIEFKILAPLF